MAFVACHEYVAEVNCRSADEQVGERDYHSLPPGFGIYLRYHLAHLARKWFSGDGREYGIEIAAAFRSLLG